MSLADSATAHRDLLKRIENATAVLLMRLSDDESIRRMGRRAEGALADYSTEQIAAALVQASASLYAAVKHPDGLGEAS